MRSPALEMSALRAITARCLIHNTRQYLRYQIYLERHPLKDIPCFFTVLRLCLSKNGVYLITSVRCSKDGSVVKKALLLVACQLSVKRCRVG
jgi:hypothetical protein